MTKGCSLIAEDDYHVGSDLVWILSDGAFEVTGLMTTLDEALRRTGEGGFDAALERRI